jgi:hypothetical protein
MKKEKKSNARTLKENKNYGVGSHYRHDAKKRKNEVRIKHGPFMLEVSALPSVLR